jgi:hypothetical protein
VRLADLNDHPPVFDKEEYEIRVPESALVNTPLTRLKVQYIRWVPVFSSLVEPHHFYSARVLGD